MKKLFLGFVLVGVLFASGCRVLNNISKLDYSYSDSEKYQVLTEKVTFESVATINVDYVSGNVTINPSTTDEISLSEEIDADIEDKYRCHYYQNGDVLNIKFIESMAVCTHSFKTKDISLTIPTSVTVMDIETISADVEVNDSSFTDFTVDTVSGDFDFDDLTSTNVKYLAVSGDMTGSDITCDSLVAETVSGKINVEDGSIKNIDCENVSGNITFELDSQLVSVDFDTVSGNMKLIIPSTTTFTATFSSVSGDFNTEFECTKAGNVYTCGAGEVSISGGTTSGDLTIKIA